MAEFVKRVTEHLFWHHFSQIAMDVVALAFFFVGGAHGSLSPKETTYCDLPGD